MTAACDRLAQQSYFKCARAEKEMAAQLRPPIEIDRQNETVYLPSPMLIIVNGP